LCSHCPQPRSQGGSSLHPKGDGPLAHCGPGRGPHRVIGPRAGAGYWSDLLLRITRGIEAFLQKAEADIMRFALTRRSTLDRDVKQVMQRAGDHLYTLRAAAQQPALAGCGAEAGREPARADHLCTLPAWAGCGAAPSVSHIPIAQLHTHPPAHSLKSWA
jgi:hypothetical protein